MKKWTFYDVFLVVALIANVGSRNVYTNLLLLIAGILELIDVIPKIVRCVKHGSK